MEIIAENDKYPEKKEFQKRSLRNLKQSLGKLLGRRCVTITEYDPTYKVAYLGNVLTGWAKGDACTEKPLNTLWKNYTSNVKPDVQMKLTVTQSGLKAVTKAHGLTEYWSHRITFCCAPKELPRIFCWVYRHEGRKLKQELRCHAVLCSKESTARLIATQLQLRLTQALMEFKRDKINRQNARLSLANSVYENPSLPRRKILLSTGSQNYRPPLERSKSAPKLMSIEECLHEEEEEENNSKEINKKVFKICESRTRSATFRNLTFSNRGHKLGGLHCLKPIRTEDIIISNSEVKNNNDNNNEKIELSSLEVKSSQENHNVEQNPFGSFLDEINDSWKTTDCSLLESINKALDLKRMQDDNLCDADNNNKILDNNNCCLKNPETGNNVDLNPSPNSRNEKLIHRNSWGGEKFSYGCSIEENNLPYINNALPSYTEVVNQYLDEFGSLPDYQDILLVNEITQNPSDCCDSFVENRKKFFEPCERSKSEGDKEETDNEMKVFNPNNNCSNYKNFVQDRKRLYETLMRQEQEESLFKDELYDSISETSSLELDEHSNIFPNFKCDSNANCEMMLLSRDKYDSDINSCFDDESTPSLQSISSGSDTSSPRDAKLGFSKNYDLDSLWEEGSDESGYVEACQETSDDKIRDLPHHHLMKNCILTSKSHCLEV